MLQLSDAPYEVAGMKSLPEKHSARHQGGHFVFSGVPVFAQQSAGSAGSAGHVADCIRGGPGSTDARGTCLGSKPLECRNHRCRKPPLPTVTVNSPVLVLQEPARYQQQGVCVLRCRFWGAVCFSCLLFDLGVWCKVKTLKLGFWISGFRVSGATPEGLLWYSWRAAHRILGDQSTCVPEMRRAPHTGRQS